MNSPAKPFTWGIIGAGGIARQFAEDLAHVPGARVGVIHTRSGKMPDSFPPLAAGAKAVASLDELLADQTIDAVYIATPNSVHAKQALAAIKAGKPVLVEKPLATTSADARRVADAAQAAGVFVMEAMWTRFLPAMQAARDIIWIRQHWRDQFRSMPSSPTGARKSPAAGFLIPRLGGGAALDLGVYPLSAALFLLGKPDSD
jgi:predicted dehydrogenase